MAGSLRSSGRVGRRTIAGPRGRKRSQRAAASLLPGPRRARSPSAASPRSSATTTRIVTHRIVAAIRQTERSALRSCAGSRRAPIRDGDLLQPGSARVGVEEPRRPGQGFEQTRALLADRAEDRRAGPGVARVAYRRSWPVPRDVRGSSLASPSASAAWNRTIGIGIVGQGEDRREQVRIAARSAARPAGRTARGRAAPDRSGRAGAPPARAIPGHRASRGRAAAPSARRPPGREVLEQRDGRGIASARQQPLGRLAPPGVGIGKQGDQLGGRGARPAGDGGGAASRRPRRRARRAARDPCRWSGRGAS